WHRCGRKLERAEFRVGGPRHSHRERHRVRWLPCRLARVDSNRRGKRTFPPRHVLAVPRFRRRRHRGGLPHLVRAAEAEARRAPSLSESRKSLAGQVRSGNILYVGGADGACMTTVLLQTTMGDVKIELLAKTMPITAGNFRQPLAQRLSDGTSFHRDSRGRKEDQERPGDERGIREGGLVP